MSVRRAIPEHDGVYFITLTCCRWIRLFEITNGYQTVYNWFDYLKSIGHLIAGYVIMPNHLHALIAFRNTKGRSINTIIGNGKRFMAYDLVRRLKELNHHILLFRLTSFVNITKKNRGHIHEIFEPSFDWKECWTAEFTEQKLDYIHNNPCAGKWNLSNVPEGYLHSSANFYATGKQGVYDIISYTDLQDMDLTKPF